MAVGISTSLIFNNSEFYLFDYNTETVKFVKHIIQKIYDMA